MRVITVAIFVLVLAIGACARTSGVVPIDENTYLISRSEKGFDVTGSAVMADAIKEANEYCESKGQSLNLIDSEEKDMVPFKSDAQAEIRFRCE